MTYSENTFLQKKIDILDKGFIVLKEYMGSDLTTVNAARISFGKQKQSFNDKDVYLV